jgi:PilZ domain
MPVERRAGPRYAIADESVLFFTGDGRATAGRLLDLSQDGCRVRTNIPVTVRAWFPVEVFFRIQGEEFRFSGIVHWAKGENLMGIRFVNMVPERMVALAQVICVLDAELRSQKVVGLAEQEPHTVDEWRARN